MKSRTIMLAAACSALAAAAVHNMPVAPVTSPIHRRRVIKVKGGYTPAPQPHNTDEIRQHNAAVEAKKAAKLARKAGR